MLSKTATLSQTPSSTRVLYLSTPAEEKAKKPKRKVVWTEDTVDNENLNRLKSNSLTKIINFLI
jgi:hypothetical protein